MRSVSVFFSTFFLIASVVFGCGGREVPVDGGPDAGTCNIGSYGICGGPENCAPANCQCTQQLASSISPTTGICASAGGNPWADPFGDLCFPGRDGRICVSMTLSGHEVWADAPFELGVMLADDGASDRVRYADLGLWTGDPIPEPSSCPSLGNVKACGGSCGDCPTGEVCVGRSPLHPVGFCDGNHFVACSANPSAAHPACSNVGDACFTYVVQPSAQSVADDAGKCFAAPDCQALAANLPGGGKCSGTK